MPRVLIIGDVHGCAQELGALLDKLEVSSQDYVLFTGDLLTRGPDPAGVMRLVHALEHCDAVFGNHERRLLKYYTTGQKSLLKPYDSQTIGALSKEDWDFLKNMKRHIYLEPYDTVLVHGGFDPRLPWQDQPPRVVTRIQVIDAHGKPQKRSECPNGTPWSDLWQGPPFVVYGHTPVQEVYRSPWALGIDTACVYGGHLTAYVLPSKVIVQVKAAQPYYKRQ
jgi:predicted phosphodiesterase